MTQRWYASLAPDHMRPNNGGRYEQLPAAGHIAPCELNFLRRITLTLARTILAGSKRTLDESQCRTIAVSGPFYPVARWFETSNLWQLLGGGGGGGAAAADAVVAAKS